MIPRSIVARIVVTLLAGGILQWSVTAASLLLTNGVIHTVSGPTHSPGMLRIADGRITDVGASAPAADHTLDLGGRHVFPGLIAPATILGLQEIDSIRATRDIRESGEYTPDVVSWVAVNPDSELIPVARANGYTHVQPMPLGAVVSGQSAVIALTGWTVEEMVIRRSAGLHVFWPSFQLDTTPREQAPNKDTWKSLEDQILARDRRLRELDEFFNDAEAYAKARTAPAPATPPAPVPAWEAVLPVLRGDLPLFVHADETRQIQSAIDWTTRRRYRAVLVGGRDAARLAPLLATNRIPVVYEHVFTPPVRDIDPYDVQFSAPGVLARAGVPVAFTEGTDQFGASSIRNIPYAAAQAMAFGLPREDAWKGLTLYPAQMLGIADRLGSLEPGKDATFFIATGDILDIRTQVERLWIAGRETPLESRHTRLYERYRKRPASP